VILVSYTKYFELGNTSDKHELCLAQVSLFYCRLAASGHQIWKDPPVPLQVRVDSVVLLRNIASH